MTKIVYNAQHGGFDLSDAAVIRYAEIKGLKLYPEQTRFGLTTWWTVPADQRSAIIPDDEWYGRSMEDRAASNAAYKKLSISPRDIARDDPALVQVVEELGEKADGQHATLEIRDLPSGTRYRIDEYDGFESVVTVDEYEWSVA